MSALPPTAAIHARMTEETTVHKVNLQARQIAREIARGLARDKTPGADPSAMHPTCEPVHRKRRSANLAPTGKTALLEQLAAESTEEQQRVATPARIAQRQAAVRERAICAARFEIQPSNFTVATNQLDKLRPAANSTNHASAQAFLCELESLARRAYYYDQALRVQLHNDPRPWWFRAVHVEQENQRVRFILDLARLDSRAPNGLSTSQILIGVDDATGTPCKCGYSQQATHFGMQLPQLSQAPHPQQSTNPAGIISIDYDVHLADQTHLPLWPFDQQGRFNPAHDGQPTGADAPWVRPAKALDWQYLLEQSFGRQRLWAQHACANQTFEHGLTALMRHLGAMDPSDDTQPLIGQSDDYTHHKFLELQRLKADQHILPHSHFERLIALPCRWGEQRHTVKTVLVHAAGQGARSGWLGTGTKLQSVNPAAA